MGKNQYWALCGNPGQVVKIWNKSLNALLGWMYTIHGSTSTKNQVHFINHPSLKQIRQFVYKSNNWMSVSHCIVYTLHKQQKQWNNDHWFIPSLEFSAPNFFGVKIGPLPQLRSSCHVTVSFSFLHFWPEPAHCPVHFQCSLSSSLSVLLPSDAAVFFSCIVRVQRQSFEWHVLGLSLPWLALLQAALCHCWFSLTCFTVLAPGRHRLASGRLFKWIYTGCL